MKLPMLLVLASLTSAPALAAPGGFWSKVRSLVEQCAAQPVTIDFEGHKTYYPLVSRCDELGAYEGSAQFLLEDEWYSAELIESEDSDGGDLFDVRIERDRDSHVAIRKNVPAFGDVLVGMAGGRVSVPEIER
jgi:hypothetical protein